MRHPVRSHQPRLIRTLSALVLFATLGLAQLLSVFAAGVLFVSPAGNDASDCQTFGTACRTIGAAVSKASAGDIIIIATGVYTEGITLGKNLTLIGSGADATIISGGGTQDVLQILAGVTAKVYDLAVVHGYSGINNHGVLTVTNGVASDNYNGMSNNGQLAVNFSAIHDNHNWAGGGIYNDHGTVSVNNSSIMSNSVYEEGAGIVNYDGNLTVTHSVIANNVACSNSCPFFAPRPQKAKVPNNGIWSSGAGIFSSGGTLTILNSTISGNQSLAGDAGGLLSNSRAIISNTTFSGNTASYGASLTNDAFMTLTNVTTNGNIGYSLTNNGNLWMQNTILDGCWGKVATISLGHNLDHDNSCGLNASGDMTFTNALLGPLQDNGGPTPTHALLPGSPAINRGTNAGCPATDQRGIARPQGVICDIGAYEFVFTDTFFAPVMLR